MFKKLLFVLCFLSVCCLGVNSAYASATILVDKKENAKIPFMFTGSFIGSKDVHHSTNHEVGGGLKVAYTGITEVPVRPYVKINVEKDKYNEGIYSVESKTYPSYGIGLEGTIAEWDNVILLGNKVGLFGDISCSYAKHKFKKYQVSGTELLNSDKKVSSEWGVMLGISKTIDLSKGNVKPYVGCEYVHVNSVMPEDKHHRDQVSPVLGTVWNVNETVALELEAKFFDKDLTVEAGVTLQF